MSVFYADTRSIAGNGHLTTRDFFKQTRSGRRGLIPFPSSFVEPTLSLNAARTIGRHIDESLDTQTYPRGVAWILRPRIKKETESLSAFKALFRM